MVKIMIIEYINVKSISSIFGLRIYFRNDTYWKSHIMIYLIFLPIHPCILIISEIKNKLYGNKSRGFICQVF